jgi:hypothetical protein
MEPEKDEPVNTNEPPETAPDPEFEKALNEVMNDRKEVLKKLSDA